MYIISLQLPCSVIPVLQRGSENLCSLPGVSQPESIPVWPDCTYLSFSPTAGLAPWARLRAWCKAPLSPSCHDSFLNTFLNNKYIIILHLAPQIMSLVLLLRQKCFSRTTFLPGLLFFKHPHEFIYEEALESIKYFGKISYF